MRKLNNIRKFITLLTALAILLNVNVTAFADGDVETESERRQRLLAASIEELEEMAQNNFDELLLAAETGTGMKVSNRPAPRYIDEVVVIKNSVVCEECAESGAGAHYYVFSPYGLDNDMISGFFDLPTDINFANETRTAYISVGVDGIHDGVHDYGLDIGIRNVGGGWHPYYYDKGLTGRDDVDDFYAYEDSDAGTVADDTAVCASFAVRPFIRNDGNIYILIAIDFYDDSNDEPVAKLVTAIQPADVDFEIENDSINCRFYRFISLVPNDNIPYDDQMDGSYMLGAGFSELELNIATEWGITADSVTNAWLVSPERIRLSYDIDSETCDIDHWSE